MEDKSNFVRTIEQLHLEMNAAKDPDRKSSYRVIMAIFLAASCTTKKRYRTIPDAYICPKGYESFSRSVCGPCYELFALFFPKDFYFEQTEKTLARYDRMVELITSDYVDTLGVGIKGKTFYNSLKKALTDKYLGHPDELERLCIDGAMLKDLISDELIEAAYSDLMARARALIFFERKRMSVLSPKTKTYRQFVKDDCESIIRDLEKKLEDMTGRDDFDPKQIEKLIIPVDESSSFATMYIAHAAFFRSRDIARINERRRINGQPQAHFFYRIIAKDIDLSLPGSEPPYSSSLIVTDDSGYELYHPAENGKLNNYNIMIQNYKTCAEAAKMQSKSRMAIPKAFLEDASGSLLNVRSLKDSICGIPDGSGTPSGAGEEQIKQIARDNTDRADL